MSTDFIDRAPLLRDHRRPLHAVRLEQSAQLTLLPTAIASVLAVFLLCSVLLFFFHRFTDSTGSTRRRNRRAPPASPHPEALRREAVAALPLVQANRRFYCCAVCLAEYEETERVKLMPVCGHVFHPECIDTWLLSHGSCPVCRCSDLWGSRAGELRLDVFEREGEGGEEDKSHSKIGRSRSSSSSSVEVEEGIRLAMVFLRRSCSF